MSQRSFAVCALLLLICGVCAAGVSVDLDHASFRANDSLAYVEVFASVQRSHLKYEEAGDSLRAEFMVRLDVLQDTSSVLSDTFRAIDAVPKADPPTKGQFFPHVFRFIMKPGAYTLRASLFQGAPEPRDVAVDVLTVTAYREDQLALSQIELGCRLEYTKEESPFVKNGVQIVPNPTRFFGTDLPLFYYYAEAYGLDYDSARADSYAVFRRIIHAENGSPARPEVKKTFLMTGTSVVIADGFPISTLRTGTYELELEVKCYGSGKSAVMRKKFWTYRPDDFIAGRMPDPSREYKEKLLEADPHVLDLIAPDSALHLMKYVLTTDQSKRVGRLNQEGKEEFVHSYWKQRELEDPGAANRYFARVEEANRRWEYLYRQGWKTDRGRIFILYGEPDQIERNYAGPQLPDHELWQYDKLEGGVIFVFLDQSGFGDLDLVHSTKRGEINNPNWNVTGPRTGSSTREGWK